MNDIEEEVDNKMNIYKKRKFYTLNLQNIGQHIVTIYVDYAKDFKMG